MKRSLINPRVIDPPNGLDGQYDLHLDGGRLIAIGEAPADFSAEQRDDLAGKLVTPAFIDLGAHLRDPGPRYKGSLVSESAAALAGGYATILPRPDTSPVLDSASHIRTLLDRARDVAGVRLAPLGALTQGLDGDLLANMAALKSAGCVALTNLRQPIRDLGVLRRCLEYARTFDITVVFQAQEAALAGQGCAHEGAIASRLGLAGIPESAETVALTQWLLLIEQTGVRAHVSLLSSARAVELVRDAKARGLDISADVSMAQLHWTDEQLEGFNANFHLEPPLRSAADRDALRAGVVDGTIDAIVSDHLPHEAAAKSAPFAVSEPGMTSLETMLPLGLALVEAELLSLPRLIETLTFSARRFGLKGGMLEVGEYCDLAVIDMEQEWRVSSETLVSAGHNTPLLGMLLNGRVEEVLLGDSCYA